MFYIDFLRNMYCFLRKNPSPIIFLIKSVGPVIFFLLKSFCLVIFFSRKSFCPVIFFSGKTFSSHIQNSQWCGSINFASSLRKWGYKRQKNKKVEGCTRLCNPKKVLIYKFQNSSVKSPFLSPRI